MISPDDLQSVKLVRFSGGITYNSNGYAVLPTYTIINILASVQPLSKSDIRLLPEGTHYADYVNILTDYNVDVDNSPTNLGDYFIYNTNVYKIMSSQNFKNFTSYTTNHISTTVARDNRLTFNGTVLNLPYAQIDDTFAPLFELIAMATSCFTAAPIPVLWAYQQELRPNFPYCTVNIDKSDNLYATNFTHTDKPNNVSYQSKSTVLYVTFRFYSYDKVQAQNFLEKFKLNAEVYNFSSKKIAYGGFDNSPDNLNEELYENRSIFHTESTYKFNFIIEQSQTNPNTIETVIAHMNYSN